MVRTEQSPTQAATVYLKMSSLCSTTGASATCGGSFAVSAGWTRSVKCAAIVDVIASNCGAAGYTVSANACRTGATFTASNVGCPGTQFALGLSNDPGVFDQTATGPLPDGEVETVCAPPPGSASRLRLDKIGGGAAIRLTWTDAPNTDSYWLFEDQSPNGSFDALMGSAASGAVGIQVPSPAGSEFFLVSGSNAICGAGPKN
jgi:hypothetical protein